MFAILLLLLTSIATFAQPVFSLRDQSLLPKSSRLMQGLVAYWPLNETTGTRYDMGRNGFHLTAFNTPGSGSGVVGNCASLASASSQYFRGATNGDLSIGSGSFTVAAWVSLTTSTANQVIVSKFASSGSLREWSLQYDTAGSTFSFYVFYDGVNSTNARVVIPATNTNRWSLLVGRKSGSTITISANAGTEYTSTLTNATVFSGTAPIAVGAVSNPALYLNGLVDEVSIWNRSISTNEILQIYRSNHGVSFPTFRQGGIMGLTSVSPASPLTIPTYDGSNQLVHPDVQYVAAGWGADSYPYWMVFTPYPAANPALENPSIVYSIDGSTWSVPPGLVNPVVSAPAAPSHAADPDLLIWTNSVAYLTYVVTDGSTTNGVMQTTSADGVTWSAPVCILSGDQNEYRSPTLVWTGTNCYMVWCTAAAQLKYSSSASPDGAWAAATSFTIPYSQSSWHQDLLFYNSQFWLLENPVAYQFYVFKSSDLIYWENLTVDRLPGLGIAGWDDTLTYRGTFLSNGSGWDLWYSGVHINTWKVGRTRILQ